MSESQNTLEQIADDAVTPVLDKKEKYSDKYFSRQAVIYFIAAGSDPVKAVKIGVTGRNTVATRLRGIQSSNHERVELLRVLEFLEGDKPGLEAERKESELHKRFSGLQRGKPWTVGAEWFNWEEPLKTFVDQLPVLPEDLQRVAHHPFASH